MWRFCNRISEFAFKLVSQPSELKNIYNAWCLTLMVEECTEAVTGWLFYDCISSHFSMSSYLLSAQRNMEKWKLYSDKHVFLSLQSSSFNGQRKWEAEGHCLALHVGPYKLAVISKILQLGQIFLCLIAIFILTCLMSIFYNKLKLIWNEIVSLV